MKKLKIFQITLVAVFLIFLFFIFKAVNYTKEYRVNDILITESYNKDQDYYYFTLTYQDITLDYLYESNYKQKRNFIKEVEIIEAEDSFCLIPEGETLEFIPLCYDFKNQTYYQNVNETLYEQIPKEYQSNTKELNENYEDINIYNKDYTYLLWNYNGFYFINEKDNKKIKLFDQEIYNANLITYTQDYLIVADYDAEYTFNKFYRISLKNRSKKEYKLDRDIYFDSYFPGFYKNKLYIVDNKERVMYEWNAKNGDLEKINAKMLYDGNWENVGIKTLINQNKKFSYESNFEYRLVDGTLTLTYKDKKNTTKIDDEVTSIIRIKDDLVFYLKTDTLYAFKNSTGIQKLLNYFEWNFNYENMIYVD